MSRLFLLVTLLFLLTGAGYTEKTGLLPEIYICRAVDRAGVDV
jgi:hypothetical protein